MPATIRLKRMGRKKQPYYRIVVADESGPRDGPPVEKLGIYNPRTEPAVVRVDAARALFWLHEGATPSHTVRSLFRRTGVWEKFHAGVTAETLEEAVVYLGPPAGEDKTTQRVSAPPKKPKVKTPSPSAAAPAAAAAGAPVAEAAEAVEDVITDEVEETVVEEAAEDVVGRGSG
jgi:small subunit ribosomal protein S16